MKRAIFSIFFIIILSQLAFAVNIDNECKIITGDKSMFGIAKYEYEHNSFEKSDGDINGFVTSVTGDDKEAHWVASPHVVAIVEKESTDYNIHDGGTHGIIRKGDHDISHITFCGSTITQEPDVPEFGIIGGALALIGAGALALRKRK